MSKLSEKQQTATGAYTWLQEVLIKPPTVILMAFCILFLAFHSIRMHNALNQSVSDDNEMRGLLIDYGASLKEYIDVKYPGYNEKEQDSIFQMKKKIIIEKYK